MISYIDAYKDQFGVEAICRVLKQADRGFITSRGYRKATTRVPSARALSDSLLIPEIRRVHAENFSVYGIRKMWHAMNREGFHIGRDKTARLMKLAGVSGRRRGRTPVTTISPKTPDHRPDLVRRNFRAQAPGRLWVADITYVRTLSGFAYTAFVVDVFSRKIVGVATRSTMRTDALPMEALKHALTTAGRIHGNQLIHHSDRGSQYVSLKYSTALAESGIRPGRNSRRLLRQCSSRDRQRSLQGGTDSCSGPVDVGRRSRTGHLAVGALVEHQAATRSIGLRHPTGNRNRVLSHRAHQHRAVKEAELNPGRFTRDPYMLW